MEILEDSRVTDRTARAEEIAQAVVRAVLFSAPVLFWAFRSKVSDPDLWWHLRSGEWIVQHHSVPYTDPFSSFAAGKPWAAYSWLFEIAVLQLFQRFGLTGIVFYTSGMVLATTIALNHLIKRLLPDFSIAVLLTFVAALSICRLDTPRSWHFSILFFILELDILMHARRTGRTRELLWLPFLFALWVNLHIQFIDGLLLLAFAAAESVAAIWWSAARSRLKLLPAILAFIACALATLCNPYGASIYRVAHDLAAQSGVMDRITELQAIPFRSLSDYCVLLLALAASAALARSASPRVFETVALGVAVFLSFRSQRDMWITSAIASAIIASSLASVSARPCGSLPEVQQRRPPVFAWPVTVIVTSLLLSIGFHVLHIGNARLRAQLEDELPVRAAAFARDKGYPGPLFNDYLWGGYLIWALRQPVSIDGRAALYGDQRIERSIATWNGTPSWDIDPELTNAGLVIGPVQAPLTQLLRLDRSFKLVYEDHLAAVFVPQVRSAK